MLIPIVVLASCGKHPHIFQFTCESGLYEVYPEIDGTGPVKHNGQTYRYASVPENAVNLDDQPAGFAFNLDGKDAKLFLSSRLPFDDDREVTLTRASETGSVENCFFGTIVF